MHDAYVLITLWLYDRTKKAARREKLRILDCVNSPDIADVAPFRSGVMIATRTSQYEILTSKISILS